MRKLRLLIGLVLLVPLFSFAQVDRATLAGTVTDASGALVPGAKVELRSPEVGFRRDAISNEDGAYTFSGVPIGVYSVTVSQAGFRTVSFKEVRLGVGDNRTLNIQMEVSAVETAVNVESVLAPLEKTSAVIGTVIGGQQMREIPLNGRHWASLMALAPGAINTGDGSQQTIRFVGRARDDNNWTLDGLDATGVKDPRQEAALRLVISTDSIAEFRVNSTLYSAESGSGAGGQVNIVSKSGSNAMHGSLFEFFRNDKMDSRNPFDPSKMPFRLNQYGGNLGGPILKDKTFFFGNYEGLRQHISQTNRNGVPSDAFRAKVTNPTVQQIVNAYPRATEGISGDVGLALLNVMETTREDSFTARVDHRFNDNNTMFGRYNFDDGTVIAPRTFTVIPGDRQESFFRPSNMVLQFQHVFSPRVVNETKAGFNRSSLHRYSYAPFTEAISVSGFQPLNNSNLLVENGTSYSIIDNLVVTRGHHTLKFGGEIRRAHVNVADPAFDAVSVTYSSRNDLLANKVNNVAITGGNDVLGTRKWYYYGYFQDDIKVSQQLTLNLGLRYEFYGVNSEAYDRYRVFDINECQGFCPHGTPWYYPDRNNFDPRVGLAWAPKALGGKTVFRMGGGLYTGPGQIDDKNAALDNTSENFTLTVLEVPTLSYPVAPFLAQAKESGITPRSLQRDIRDLYSAQWGFSIQQELPASFVTQIGYVGSSASNVTARSDVNTLDPVTRKRQLPNFGRIDEKRGDGNSNFNALQVSLHRRVGRGLTWGTEYMWSHSINDNSIGGGEGTQIQNVRCRACDRGNSSQDIRHTITSNWIYQLPFGPGERFLNSGAASKILGGWELSGIWTMRTGRMLNITMSRSSNDLPDGNNRNPRPNLVSGVSIYPDGGPTFGLWLNPAAFSMPASRVWGSAGRALATGPGLAQVDFSLNKSVHITERKSIVFRVEAYNIFNRTQAGNPATGIGSVQCTPSNCTGQRVFVPDPTFGLVTTGLNRSIGTGTSRQMQLALRFVF